MPTTLPRLLDMGIEPFLIASTVNTVIGQRLVRRLCQVCRLGYIPEGVELSNIKRDFQLDTALKKFNEMKGTLTEPGAPAPEPAAPEPEREESAEHKKGK